MAKIQKYTVKIFYIATAYIGLAKKMYLHNFSIKRLKQIHDLYIIGHWKFYFM